MKWMLDIFNCDCKEKPYCDCGRLNLEKLILSLRRENKLTISEICQYLKDEYEIVVFKGDIVDFLETFIYSVESITEIAMSIKNLDPNYMNQLEEISIMVEEIKQ